MVQKEKFPSVDKQEQCSTDQVSLEPSWTEISDFSFISARLVLS